jgi:hypothetical protein
MMIQTLARAAASGMAGIVWPGGLVVVVSFGALACHVTTEAATMEVADATSLHAALRAAVDGDEIVLAAGTYPGRFEAIGLTGVTVRSADPAQRAVIDATGAGEGIKLVSAHRVTLSDLVIQGAQLNAINVDDGGFVASSTDITIRNVLLKNGGGQGVKFAGVDGFHIDRLQAIGWGGNGSAVDLVGVHNGLVERSYFESTNPAAGTGVQAKGGSTNVTVRANRFVNANERSIQIGGSTSLRRFRPQPPGAVEAMNIVAEGNVIINNGGPALPAVRSAVSFINTADGVFRNNLVIRPTAYVMRILKENHAEGFVNTQHGQFNDNIVIWQSGDLWDAVDVGRSTDGATFKFSGNHWFNRTKPSASRPNLPSPEVKGVYGVDPEVGETTLVPWAFDWGKWVVNKTHVDLMYSVDAADSWLVATPGDDAALDLGQANPLSGSWNFAQVTTPQITIGAFSYLVLMKTQPCDLNGNRM